MDSQNTKNNSSKKNRPPQIKQCWKFPSESDYKEKYWHTNLASLKISAPEGVQVLKANLHQTVSTVVQKYEKLKGIDRYKARYLVDGERIDLYGMHKSLLEMGPDFLDSWGIDMFFEQIGG